MTEIPEHLLLRAKAAKEKASRSNASQAAKAETVRPTEISTDAIEDSLRKDFERLLAKVKRTDPGEEIIERAVAFISLFNYYEQGDVGRNYATYSPDTVWGWLQDEAVRLAYALSIAGIKVPPFELDEQAAMNLKFWQEEDEKQREQDQSA